MEFRCTVVTFSSRLFYVENKTFDLTLYDLTVEYFNKDFKFYYYFDV